MARMSFKGVPATVLFEAAKAMAEGDVSDKALEAIWRTEEVVGFVPDVPYTSIKQVPPQAMNDEVGIMTELNVYKESAKPDSELVVGSLWVFTRKIDIKAGQV
ncbi:hypothetical protein BCR44DRAFT_59281 [Catenaria anguillulae PL171]|uniref:Uncharacterized protein n=1 Tax=Catenaria anguillulae PL171 TaxID=765915 RepID=A0A1Y2HPG7_9FUNG|nr:hypothetical protein BCR44DRAFT_59281 [Catenaria anguillulae PL171]